MVLRPELARTNPWMLLLWLLACCTALAGEVSATRAARREVRPGPAQITFSRASDSSSGLQARPPVLGDAESAVIQSVESDLFCTFSNDDGDQCRQLDSHEYTRSWCTGRARGQVGPSCVRAWVAPAAQQIFEEATGAAAGRRPLVVDWAAQRGEAEHAQLALRSFGEGLANLTVAIACGERGLPAAWLSVRQVGQLYANATFVAPPRGPGWWPDPLLPLEQGAVGVERGRTSALWLTLSVPADAAPRRFNGSVTVRAVGNTTGQSMEVVVTLDLQVWDIVLPPLAEAHFANFFQFQFQPRPFGARSSNQIRGVLDNYYGGVRLPQVKAEFFELLCASRIPPIGYGLLRNFSDMVTPLAPDRCTGTVPPTATATAAAGTAAGAAGIPFSIMSISDLFGHQNPAKYSSSYFTQLWAVLDPVVAELNRSGHLPHASVYGFDEAHPKAVYEPIIAQLYGAVKARYRDQLATVATLHYCPSLGAPIDILVHSYADYPNGTSEAAHYGVLGQPGEFCEPGFPAIWAASSPRRRYFQYHCFSPRSPDDQLAGNPTWPLGMYGAMNTFVDYPRIHNRLLPWWATSNDGVSGWLYFEVSEWRFDSGPKYPASKPYENHTHPMPMLPSFVRQPNDGFVEERVPGGESASRLTFNVNKYYANVYGGGTTAGDGVFIYPGRNGPVSGARLETWRDGSEDAELFMRLPLLQRQQLVHRLVRSIGEWEDDPLLLERVRREAAQAVLSHASIKTDDNHDGAATAAHSIGPPALEPNNNFTLPYRRIRTWTRAPGTVKGYYSWNWGKGSSPKGANNGVAFTGLADVGSAIAGYPWTGAHSWCTCPKLEGTSWISLGGGNAAGEFTAQRLVAIASKSNTSAIAAANYSGVMFDVEEVVGPAETMVPLFAKAFAACKAAGLAVGVTTSHSAPHQTDAPADAVALVKAWAADTSIDILSPQLYSSGSEAAPEFDETASCEDAGCTWELYVGAKAAFAPSIVEPSQLDAVTAYFSARNISTAGYFEWKQE
jgi:hypothetical protein